MNLNIFTLVIKNSNNKLLFFLFFYYFSDLKSEIEVKIKAQFQMFEY